MPYVTAKSLLPLVAGLLFMGGIAHVHSSGGCVLDEGLPRYTEVSRLSNVICFAMLPSGQMCSGTVTSYEMLMDSRDFDSSFKPQLEGCKINRKELMHVEQDCYHLTGSETPSGGELVPFYRATSCARRLCDGVGRPTSRRCRGPPGTNEGQSDRDTIRLRELGSPGVPRSPGSPGGSGGSPAKPSPLPSDIFRRRSDFLRPALEPSFPQRLPEDSQDPTDPSDAPGQQNLRPCQEVRPTEEDVVCDSGVTLRLTDEARQALRAIVQNDIWNDNVQTSYNLTEMRRGAKPIPGQTCFRLFSKSGPRHCITSSEQM